MNLDEWKESGIQLIKALRVRGEEEAFRRLLSELYPDTAHFIYELLQNAEDTKATSVDFLLNGNFLDFIHDGQRLFTEEDVKAITSFGNSTKRNDPTTIGKFGVGFKAVFAYTNTPEIHSGDFHFCIRDLVVPDTEGVEQAITDKAKTQFLFPFDNPKKQAANAVQEIEEGLRDLGDNTLLFLSHIRKIDYSLPDGSLGSLESIDHSNGHIEIRTTHPHDEATESHWLHFQKEVEVTDEDGELKTCRIAIAYQLEQNTDKNKKESGWKIVSVQNEGQVSIYFPAEKETSKLRFHIHAPFASTVARDSVRDCTANEQLRDHLATLIVESLTTIRDQGMLTMSFLAVLPNPRDSLAKFYEPIRQAIVKAFKNNSLTPTRSGSHAKAEALYRGPAKIAGIIDDEDLSLLTDYDTPLWAANPPQMNQREDNFLDNLAIDKFDYSQLSSVIKPNNQEKILSWLEKKDDQWIMDFYGLLKDANWRDPNFPIVRINSEQGIKHVSAQGTYFASEDSNMLPPVDLPIAKRAVYAKGDKSDDINQPAKSFLERLGVKPFNEKAIIELRLKHYPLPSFDVTDGRHIEDIKQFMAYWKKNTYEKTFFQDYCFLLAASNNGHLDWKKATGICFDSPFIETGLSELIDIHQKNVVWDGYNEHLNEQELNDFIDFAKAIGVMHQLEVIKLDEKEALKNPKNPYGENCNLTHTGSVCDYSIPNLEKYLEANNFSASRLIWNALIKANQGAGNASFKPNQKHDPKEVESQLVHYLKKHTWIPNITGEFCTPQKMTRDELPDDFLYDNGNKSLDKIGFGENARNEKLRRESQDQQITQKNSAAQNLGFNSAEQAAQFAELAKLLSLEELQKLFEKKTQCELPEGFVTNRERRRQHILEDSENALDKESVQRERSIQKNLSPVKARAKAYLRPTYQNSNHELICQCCDEEMPFKLNEYHYFEAVQCLEVKENEKRHHQNYLALCPVCAAMYKHSRATDDTELRHLIVENEAPDDARSVEIPLILAGQPRRLRFVGTHFFDLKTVLNK